VIFIVSVSCEIGIRGSGGIGGIGSMISERDLEGGVPWEFRTKKPPLKKDI